MSKLEYINPSDWSLHVIDGENEGVPEGWIELPKGADFLAKCSDGLFSLWSGNVQFAVKESGEIKASKYIVDRDEWIKKWNPEIFWSRKMKEYLVERDGKYELVEAYHLDGGIEVPEGSTAYVSQKGIYTGFVRKNVLSEEDLMFALWVRHTSTEKISSIDNCNRFIDCKKMHQDNVDSILSERQSQYGCYEDVAKTTQDILKALRIGNYENIPAPHQEALHMIASKMARLVHGDANHLDSWVDIGGYSKLIVNLIEGGK